MANIYYPRQMTPDEIFAAAKGDPRYVSGTAAAQAQQNANLQNLLENSRRAMIQLGYIPQGFNDVYGVLNPETRSLIEQNTGAGLSTYARLRRARDMAVRALKRQLAARGALRSGELGFGLNDLDLQNRQQTADAFSNLFDKYGQMVGGYTQAGQSILQQQQNLLNTIYGDLSQNPTFTQQPVFNTPVPQSVVNNIARTSNALADNPGLFTGGTAPTTQQTIYQQPKKTAPSNLRFTGGGRAV